MILEYNTTHLPNLPFDNNEEDIGLRASNYNDKRIRLRPANNMDSNNNRDIAQQRLTTPDWILRKRLLSELSRNFKKVMFSKSSFLFGISLLDIRYEHPGSQNNNLFYSFNN